MLDAFDGCKKYCLTRIGEIFLNKFARASIWMIGAGIISGVFGYLFQIAIGRILDPGKYSLFAALMAIVSVFGTLLNTISMVIAKEAAKNVASKNFIKIYRDFWSINIRAIYAGTLLLIFFYIFAHPIKNYLNSQDVLPVYLLGLILFLVFPVTINNAFLQGVKNFSWLGFGGILASILKVGFPVALYFMGYGFSGVISGVALMYVFSWIFSVFGLRGYINSKTIKIKSGSFLMFDWRAILPIFLANIAFALMTQFDVVLVNHYFAPDVSGLYASASVLGKAILYLPGGLVMALFPFASEGKALGKSGNELLFQALLFTFFLCLSGAIFYFFFSAEVLSLFYGDRYLGASELLKYYGFAILPMSLVMVIEHFLIARGRVLFAYLFALVAPLQLFLTSIFHEALLDVLLIMGGCGVFLIMLGFIFMLRILKSNNTQLLN